jgi:GT2 family glycosyltransferase
MLKEPRTCAVIVNWNKKKYVVDLIKSLRDISYKNFDIVVIDNASTDDSVEAIKCFSEVKLICNTENLGGTGGFNTGIKFVLEQNCYEYVWLLDNDAQITSDTLLELVNVAHDDPRIGVSGSMTLNPDMKDMIVDLGGYVSWKQVMCKPNMNNQSIPAEGLPSIVEVDYTPACSALVRVDAIQKTGIMDERYFLHWDDVDLCLRIRQAGYKIVAVSNSRIFHETEKGSNPVVDYYNVRNGLLIISKHLKTFQRIIAIRNILRRCCKFIVLSYLTDMRDVNSPPITAFVDFMKGHFYRIGNISFTSVKSSAIKFDTEKMLSDLNKRILILPNGSTAEIIRVWKYMESLGCKNLFLLINESRKELFPYFPLDRIITYNNKNSSLKALALLIKIATGGYAFVVSPTSMTMPFSYAAKRCLQYDSKSGDLYQSNENIKHFWKTIVSFFAGEITAIALLPFLFIKSNKYYLNSSVK